MAINVKGSSGELSCTNREVRSRSVHPNKETMVWLCLSDGVTNRISDPVEAGLSIDMSIRGSRPGCHYADIMLLGQCQRIREYGGADSVRIATVRPMGGVRRVQRYGS